MTEQLAPNRITMREAGAPKGAPERHVTDLPKDLAQYSRRENPADKTPSGPITMYDNRGLLKTPPYVELAGDLVEGVAKAFIEDGEAVVPTGNPEANQELRILVGEVGNPIYGPRRRAIVPAQPESRRIGMDYTAIPINGDYRRWSDHQAI